MRSLMVSLCVLLMTGSVLVSQDEPAEPPEQEEVPETLTVLRPDRSGDLDPHSTSSGGDVGVLEHIYEGLVRRRADGRGIEPVLAESWEVNDDCTRYTFKIRQGVKFHDGAELDAHAVKRSFDRLISDFDPARPPARPYRTAMFGHIDKVEVTEDGGVKFVLAYPDAFLPELLALHAALIISPKAIEHIETLTSPDQRRAWLTRHPAGTGPYRLASARDFGDGERVRLTRFEDYRDGARAYRFLFYETVLDHRMRLSRFSQGQADVMKSVDHRAASELADVESVSVHTARADNLCYLAMNCDPESGFKTADKRVREAIALAVDRNLLAGLYSGFAAPHHVLVPPGIPGHPEEYRPETDRLPRQEAILRARALVREAGAEGTILTMFVPDTGRPYMPKPEDSAELIRTQLALVGLVVAPARLPLFDLTRRVHENEFALVLIGWMSSGGNPLNYWQPLLGGYDGQPGGSNLARFGNSDVQEQIQAATRATSREEALRIIDDLERSVHDEHRPIVPLVCVRPVSIIRNTVRRASLDADGQLRAE
jgi:peptide/nickel transport system substrate-binding protein